MPSVTAPASASAQAKAATGNGQDTDNGDRARPEQDDQRRHGQQLGEQARPEAAAHIARRALGHGQQRLLGGHEHHQPNDQANAEGTGDGNERGGEHVRFP